MGTWPEEAGPQGFTFPMASQDQPTGAHYDPDFEVRSEGPGEDIYRIVESRIHRRSLMKAGLGAVLGAAAVRFGAEPAQAAPVPAAASAGRPGLRFQAIRSSVADRIQVPAGYKHQVVIAWGDALDREGVGWAQDRQSGKAQAHQFGYNNDFLGYMPLPFGSSNSSHGLLVANHEYVNPEIMFPAYTKEGITAEQVSICKEAVGMAVVELKQNKAGDWEVVAGSRFNKRFTCETPFDVAGPARGHDWMKTKASPDGTKSMGTCSNCAAGKTPWGTVLSGEENFQDNFANALAETDPAKVRSHKRYGISDKASEYGWELHDPRFDVGKEPNECFHFGWVVEIDPYDPSWTPKKRTTLGRFRHEAATTHVTKKGRVVMYSGCDGRFEYVYKFVCAKPFNRRDRLANRDILDEGVLYAARFNEDGTGEWLPLVFGQGPLTAANGFNSQGDVVINARIAADLLGATKMDRPEDIEVNPVNEKVYIVCTNNTDRGKDGRPGPDKANPRSENRHGHIIELIEQGNDHAASAFAWELFLVCGDPSDDSTFFAGYDKSLVAPVSCPDNITFDHDGNLWIATDGQPRSLAINDGLYAVPVEGPERGRVKQFMSIVKAAELCGPELTPDGATLFAAVQHPGEGSTYEKPSTSWPGHSGIPRPAVIAVTRSDGGRIGE